MCIYENVCRSFALMEGNFVGGCDWIINKNWKFYFVLSFRLCLWFAVPSLVYFASLERGKSGFTALHVISSRIKKTSSSVHNYKLHVLDVCMLVCIMLEGNADLVTLKRCCYCALVEFSITSVITSTQLFTSRLFALSALFSTWESHFVHLHRANSLTTKGERHKGYIYMKKIEKCSDLLFRFTFTFCYSRYFWFSLLIIWQSNHSISFSYYDWCEVLTRMHSKTLSFLYTIY